MYFRCITKNIKLHDVKVSNSCPTRTIKEILLTNCCQYFYRLFKAYSKRFTSFLLFFRVLESPSQLIYIQTVFDCFGTNLIKMSTIINYGLKPKLKTQGGNSSRQSLMKITLLFWDWRQIQNIYLKSAVCLRTKKGITVQKMMTLKQEYLLQKHWWTTWLRT